MPEEPVVFPGAKVEVEVPLTNVAERLAEVDVMTAPCDGAVPAADAFEKTVGEDLVVH